MTEAIVWPEKMTLSWLQKKYASGQLSPNQVVQEIVRRAAADADNPIWILAPSMERARSYIEKLERMDRAKTPLWGVPFAVKDNIDVAGMPTTAACPEYAYMPEANAPVVQRLVEAGGIPIGKTNLDQFATGLVGTRSPYGETRNALVHDWISGGSSSGSAVAVARGHAVFSLGTDTAGSGRVPAALNGIVGYKPSLGAWPTKGVVPACASLDCVTVFTHALEDALAVDAAARGPHADDPWSRNFPAPVPDLPRRICLPAETPAFFGPLASEYERAWHTAVKKLEELERFGVAVERINTRLFEEAAAILYDGPWVAERWAALGGFIEAHPGATFPVTEQVLRTGASETLSAADVFRSMHRLQELKLKTNQLLQDAVLVLPTAGGTYTRDQVRENPIGANSDMGKYTNHCNLLDLCAVAVPAGEAAPNMPFGITLFATSDQEGLLAGTAAAFTGELLANAATSAKTTLLAVCGLHMRGLPLEHQMQEAGAVFLQEAATAPKYRFVKLPTAPAKPGLIKKRCGGEPVRIELWEMPLAAFGPFAAGIPAPLGIGKVELEDGREVPGFVCEGYAEELEGAEDISALGSWRVLLEQK